LAPVSGTYASMGLHVGAPVACMCVGASFVFRQLSDAFAALPNAAKLCFAYMRLCQDALVSMLWQMNPALLIAVITADSAQILNLFGADHR